MAINLLGLKPHEVSRDLSGYVIYLYGPGGCGKTTFASHMESSLLLAFEKGFSAIPGVIAYEVNSWTKFKEVCRELKKPEVKSTYKTIAIDTVDVATQYLEKYICNQLDIENIGDGGWATNSWVKVKREWEQTIRQIIAEGYSLLFISHAKDKTFTRKDNTTYNQIVPSCPTAYNEIIRNMSDIMAYIDVENGSRKMVLRSPNDSVECKSRFKCIDAVIPFSCQSLTDALNRAIDKEAEETGGKYITNEKRTSLAIESYNYDSLMAEFQEISATLMKSDPSVGPKIVQIIERYLGKGKKVNDTNPGQAEFIYLINNDLKEDLLHK